MQQSLEQCGSDVSVAQMFLLASGQGTVTLPGYLRVEPGPCQAVAQHHESALSQVLSSYSVTVVVGLLCRACSCSPSMRVLPSVQKCGHWQRLVAPVTLTGNVGSLYKATNLNNALSVALQALAAGLACQSPAVAVTPQAASRAWGLLGAGLQTPTYMCTKLK